MPRTLLVTGRTDDFQVQMPNGAWAAAKSFYAALGDLLAHHPELFDIEIKFDESAERRQSELFDAALKRELKRR